MKISNTSKSEKMPDFAFRMMSLIHDNPLCGYLRKIITHVLNSVAGLPVRDILHNRK